MGDVIDLNNFVAKKEQEKQAAEQAEYDALYNFIGEILENNPPEFHLCSHIQNLSWRHQQ